MATSDSSRLLTFPEHIPANITWNSGRVLPGDVVYLEEPVICPEDYIIYSYDPRWNYTLGNVENVMRHAPAKFTITDNGSWVFDYEVAPPVDEMEQYFYPGSV